MLMLSTNERQPLALFLAHEMPRFLQYFLWQKSMINNAIVLGHLLPFLVEITKQQNARSPSAGAPPQ
jgi:hypothetical protein